MNIGILFFVIFLSALIGGASYGTYYIINMNIEHDWRTDGFSPVFNAGLTVFTILLIWGLTLGFSTITPVSRQVEKHNNYQTTQVYGKDVVLIRDGDRQFVQMYDRDITGLEKVTTYNLFGYQITYSINPTYD